MTMEPILIRTRSTMSISKIISIVGAVLLRIVATAQGDGTIAFGTRLAPRVQMARSRALAKTLAKDHAPEWRAKGDQHRTYRYPGTDVDVAYRISVPASWDGKSKLPLVLFLHGGGSDESRYLDQNDGQLVKLAQQHGYLLMSPLGWSPQDAYGSCLRLPAVFGQAEAAARQRTTA